METINLGKIICSLKSRIEKANEELYNEIKDSENMLISPQYIKIVFSEKILEDMIFLSNVEKNEFYKNRYGDMLIRSVTEQIIECLYLLKKPEEIGKFMGMEIDDNICGQVIENESIKSILDKIKKMGGGRYENSKRKSVFEMAREIDEYETKENFTRLSLYSIYGLLSDRMHNAYYKSILDDVEQVENSDGYKEQIDDFRLLLVKMLIEAFLHGYERKCCI